MAGQHTLRQLEQQFPNFSSEIIHDMLYQNEYDYALTLACISSMLDEHAPISIPTKSQSFPAKSMVSSSTSDQSSAAAVKPIDELVSPSYEISRYDARTCAAKRKEYYNKADQANRQGMTGVASYYINQACEQTRLMKDANRIACEHLSSIRLQQFRQTHRLDLHELHIDEALQLFKQVEQELSKGNRRTTPKSIEVITGYGKNSPYGGGSGKIRSTILNYLRQKNFK